MYYIHINEEFRKIKIKGIRNMYEISEYGTVRNWKTGRYINHEIDKDGYHRVTLEKTGKKHKRKHFVVSRLVAFIFLDPDENFNELQINHKNFDKNNNHYSNLEIITQHENILHARRGNVQKVVRGIDHPSHKFSESTIHHICKLLEDGKSRQEILDNINPSKADRESYRKLIIKLARKITWKHICYEYNYEPEPYDTSYYIINIS